MTLIYNIKCSIIIFQEKKHNNNDDDIVSLYIFGEDESVLAAEAEKNNGIVSYHKVAKHHYTDIPLSNGNQHHQVRPLGNDSFVCLLILIFDWLIYLNFCLHWNELNVWLFTCC